MAMTPNTGNIYITAKDETKAALKSISQGIAGVISPLTALVSVSAVVAASFQSLKKYADLMDFEKFGIGTDKALVFVDTLKLAGMEMAAVDKAFTELTVNVEKGIRDEKVKKTFSELGIGIEKLKNMPIGDIYDEVFKKLGEIEDKAKGLALAKEVFGKNGAKIFDAAQDGEIQRYKEYMSQFAQEVRLATKEADNLFKNIDMTKELIKNDLANAWGPVLVPVNALITTIRDMIMETNKAKNELELMGEIDSFSNLILEAADFGFTLADGIMRGIELFKMLCTGFDSGIILIKLLVNDIANKLVGAFEFVTIRAKQFAVVLAAIATKDFSMLKGELRKLNEELERGQKIRAEGQGQYRDDLINQLSKNKEDLSKAWDKFSSGDSLLGNKETFLKNLKDRMDAAKKAAQQSMQDNSTKSPAGREGMGFDGAFKDQLDKQLKMLQLTYDREKYDIDLLSKYNELYRQDNIKGLQDYYDKKWKLMDEDYQAQMKNLQSQLAIAQQGLSGNIPEKDRIQYQEKVLEIQNQIHKAEGDYQLKVEETNKKQLQDRLSLTERITNANMKLQQLAEDDIRISQMTNAMDIFAANGKIVESRTAALKDYEQAVINVQDRIAQLGSTPELEVQLQEAVVALRKFQAEIDPIATEINMAFTGALAGFFSDIVEGSMTATEAFQKMGRQMERVITNLVAQALAQNLMGALFGGMGGGPGSFFTSMFSKGLFGGGGMGGLFGGGLGGALATGGDLTNLDKPYLVGEKGPELFFPGKSGYVMNNNDTKNALSNGGGRPIVMNITTQDADSFRSSKGQIMADMNRAMAMSQRNL